MILELKKKKRTSISYVILTYRRNRDNAQLKIKHQFMWSEFDLIWLY